MVIVNLFTYSADSNVAFSIKHIFLITNLNDV